MLCPRSKPTVNRCIRRTSVLFVQKHRLTVDLLRFCSSSDLIVQLRVFFSGIEVVGTSRNLMDYYF
jgi:hypothetical protein